MASAATAIRPPLSHLIPSRWDHRGRPNTDALLTWVDQALADGESYLQQQSSYNDIDLAVAAIRGQFSEKRPAKLSKLFLNKTKQYMREMIGMLSNIRPMTDYRVESAEPVPQKVSFQLNQLYKAWYLGHHIDDKIDGALQYAAIAKGYMEVGWDPPDDFDADADGDIGVHVRGPRDVLVIQPSEDHDLQKAYAVIIKKEIALNTLRSQWPKRAAEITADHDTMTTGARSLATAILRNFMSMFGPGSTNEHDPSPFPTCDVFYIYTRDDSLNETDAPIDMEPGKLWGYTAQPLTGQMWTGLYEMDWDGRPKLDDQQQPIKLMRPVKRAEAMLYPNRRLTICTRTLVFYDGPSYYWHGQVPLVPFDLDKWVFEWLGYSVVRDAQSANDSINNVARGVDDLLNLRLRPSVLVDSNSASQSFLEDLDLRIPGKVYEMPMNTVETPLKLALPYQMYEVPQIAVPFVEMLMQQGSELMMLPQVKQMAQAKQTPSGDAIEKLQELMGPGMQRLSRRMERSLRDLGEMFKWLVFEFYTTAKKSEELGPDGTTPIDIDWDAGCMVPDLLDEYPEYAGPENRYRRARIWCKQFRFRITPNSMHNMTQTYRKQMNLLLLKAGFPIDPWTIAESLDMVNFGPPPKDAKTIMERWSAWQDMQVKLKTILAQEMQEASGGGPGQGMGGGRPQSMKQGAHPEMKEQGTRITQSTS
jgi:hypothetical protein